MKSSAFTIAFVLSGLPAAALAEHSNPDPNGFRNDRARVTRIEQISEQRNFVYQECWNEERNRDEGGYYRDSDGRLYRQGDGRKSGSTGGAIIGAIIGGALGNQVGKGSGRTAATIAGAAIGAGVGNSAGSDERKHDRNRGGDYDRYSNNSGSELRCRTVADNDYRSRYGDHRFHDYISYRVTYTYAGQSYQSITDSRPGRYVSVLVDVQMQD